MSPAVIAAVVNEIISLVNTFVLQHHATTGTLPTAAQISAAVSGQALIAANNAWLQQHGQPIVIVANT